MPDPDLRRPGGRCTWLLLITLMVGFVSAGIDLLDDHSQSLNKLPGQHVDSQRESRDAHLVHYSNLKKAPPCNVCFFHKLLRQTLIPEASKASGAETVAHDADVRSVSISCFRFHSLVNRGPPGA
jgi:hypothetical protein